MVDERLDPLHERQSVRQFGVDVEGRFVDPARVDIKKAWVAKRAEGADPEAARLGARGGENGAQRRGESGCVARAAAPGAEGGLGCLRLVMPANAGIQVRSKPALGNLSAAAVTWTPACAGVTRRIAAHFGLRSRPTPLLTNLRV